MNPKHLDVRRHVPISDFRIGRYQHYKGGLYTATGIVLHHETQFPMVIYTADDHPGLPRVRPLIGWTTDQDGWFDPVHVPDGIELPQGYPYQELPDGRYCIRFRYMENEP